jgi:hypothetical protein
MGKKEQVTMHTSEKRLPVFRFLDLPTREVLEKALGNLYGLADESEVRRNKLFKFPSVVSVWYDF